MRMDSATQATLLSGNEQEIESMISAMTDARGIPRFCASLI